MSRFSEKEPFLYSIQIAKENNCDITIPNGPGIGNIVCFTRLIEELSMNIGRPLNILTAPIAPRVGVHSQELDYPLFVSNPFINKIVNSDKIDTNIIKRINDSKDDLCQFSHIIENLCFPFKIYPRKLRGALFLSKSEANRALKRLSKYKRPIIVLHPYGKSSSPKTSKWFIDKWKELIDLFPQITFIQLGLRPSENKSLQIPYPTGTLRDAIAMIWASDMFIGFDSGLAHIATAFEKPCVVLWDNIYKEPIEQAKEPGFAVGTMLRWAYPQNKNLMLLGEKEDEILELVSEYIYRNISHSIAKNKL